jgi:hypothetical protein
MSDMAGDSSRVDLTSGSERRMINRIAAYWEEIRGDRQFPAMTDIDPARLEEVKSNCFVLDVSESVDEPVIRFVGEVLAENGVVARAGESLASVPKRSLFGRISEHYLECVANGAPVGIEAEFDNEKGATVLYRGVVVPFSDDGQTIDFVLGAINFRSEASEASKAPEGTAAPEVSEALEASQAHELPEIPETPEAPDAATPANDVVPPVLTEATALLDSLSRCRHLAQQANESMKRSRDALYTALAEAYGFRFEAEAAPEAYDALLADAGIEAHERAPYTPVVKLVFGVDYDKTRISEYAAALAYGLRCDVPRQDFKAFLEGQEGGIKACVAAERAARRAERGESWDSIAYARSILRAQPALGHLDNVELDSDEEFVLILGRREPRGNGVELVTVLHEKPALVDGVLRRAAIRATSPAAVPESEEAEPASDEPANENSPRTGGKVEAT